MVSAEGGLAYGRAWLRIRDDLPKKGRKTDAMGGEPKLPIELQGALHSLYDNYEKYYQLWEQNATGRAQGHTPPVFIVVCNNTNVSKMVFDYIAGWEKQIGDQTIAQAGALPIFRNDDGAGGWLHRPNTILVDSEQLESGEALDKDFRDAASDVPRVSVAEREMRHYYEENSASFSRPEPQLHLAQIVVTAEAESPPDTAHTRVRPTRRDTTSPEREIEVFMSTASRSFSRSSTLCRWGADSVPTVR